MSVLLIASLKINDPRIYQEYVKQARPIIKRYGGKYLLVSQKILHSTMASGTDKVIIIEFPNKHKYESCFSSKEYKQIVHLRLESTESKLVVVEGNSFGETMSTL